MHHPAAEPRTPSGPTARYRARSLLLTALLALTGLAPGWSLAGAPGGPCPGTPHRFESFALHAAALERTKRILVYLPPGYDCDPARRYPVVFFNDGHDLFDWDPFAAMLDPSLAAEIARREGWYGSWRLDAQLDRAIAAGRLPPLVVVGIASDDGMRSRDLAPAPWTGSAEARGALYGEFIAEAVVAAVEARLRVTRDRGCRAIAGASLGGVSALQIGLAHPERFGLVLAFSPVLTDSALAGAIAGAWPRAGPAQALLVDFDDDPIGRADRRWLASLLAATGRSVRETTVLQSAGGRHAIASWAERVIPALARLFDRRCLE